MARGPYAAIGAAIVAVSFSSIFISWSSSDYVTIALYRLAFATAILLPFVLMRRDCLRGISRRDVLLMAVVGAILATHFTLWIASLKAAGVAVPVASSVILVTSHPILVGLLSHFVFKERVNRTMAVGILLGFGGVIAIALADYRASAPTLVGDLLAFLGGVAAGLYLLAGRRIRQRVSLTSYAFIVYASATGVLFLYTIVLGASLAPKGDVPRELVLFLAMALIPHIGGHTLYNWALKWVSAPVVSLSLVGEPIGSSLLAWVLLSQVPPALVGLGGALAIVGIAMTAYASPIKAAETST